MPAVNFNEIPPSNTEQGRDQWEQFARDFLELKGLKIVEGPDRGADGGRDLIAVEVRSGAVGKTDFRWLVSCKHKSHSGRAVSEADEPNISDRVKRHACNGFIGVYTVIPTSGLSGLLYSDNLEFETEVFGPERIENDLLTLVKGDVIASRYFPISYQSWKSANHKPVKLFSEDAKLNCFYCGTDLLEPDRYGIIVIWKTRVAPQRTEHLYWCCKGKCDSALEFKYESSGLSNYWEDIPDLKIPTLFARFVISSLKEFHIGESHSEDAFKALKSLLLNLLPSVVREQTTDEKDRIADIMLISDV